jgi:hypothetical protein
MLAQGSDGLSKTAYERHQPEQTLLYQLVEAHYPALVDQLAQQGIRGLPEVRPTRARLSPGALRQMPLRAAGGVLLQKTRVLPQLWRPPHGRDRRPAGR